MTGSLSVAVTLIAPDTTKTSGLKKISDKYCKTGTASCIFTPLTIYHLKKMVRYGIIRISSGNEGDNLIFVSNYAAYLPTEEELKRELMKDELTKLDDE